MARPFSDFLREQRGGESQEELAEALNALVAAVERTGKKGKLVYTVEIEPVPKAGGGQVTVTDAIDVKLPKPRRSASLFFSTPENNLVRHDPRQQKLPLREIAAVAPTEFKDVEKANG